MKVLITGANGQLGKELIESKPQGIKLIALSKSELNLRDKKSCYEIIDNLKPDWIINCGAYTNVEKAESNYELAYEVNALGPKYLSESLLKNGGKLLHLSTDYVFNGKNNLPYAPNSEKSPLNIYGVTKSKGEDFIKDILFSSKSGIILRTSWLIGKEGQNFALKIMKLLKEKSELNVINDQIGSPTSTKTLSNVCWKTIQLKKQGLDLPSILHYTDSGIASWYDLAVEISKIVKRLNLLSSEAIIKPISSSKYKTIARRPNYSVLDCFSSKLALSLKDIHWRDSIEELIKEINIRSIY
tara:strand:+ start:270 stop:1166 length:897 start_codon:yes stop_codon:yes gene_type:complete